MTQNIKKKNMNTKIYYNIISYITNLSFNFGNIFFQYIPVFEIHCDASTSLPGSR